MRGRLRDIFLFLPVGNVYPDGEEKNHAFYHILVHNRQVHQAHAVIKACHNHGADNRPDYGSHTTGRAGSADYTGGYGVKFKKIARRGGGRVKPGGKHYRRYRTHRPHQYADEHFCFYDIDP